MAREPYAPRGSGRSQASRQAAMPGEGRAEGLRSVERALVEGVEERVPHLPEERLAHVRRLGRVHRGGQEMAELARAVQAAELRGHDELLEGVRVDAVEVALER